MNRARRLRRVTVAGAVAVFVIAAAGTFAATGRLPAVGAALLVVAAVVVVYLAFAAWWWRGVRAEKVPSEVTQHRDHIEARLGDLLGRRLTDIETGGERIAAAMHQPGAGQATRELAQLAELASQIQRDMREFAHTELRLDLDPDADPAADGIADQTTGPAAD